MRIAIHAVGRLKHGPERELCERYLDRLTKTGPALGFEFAGLQEIAESKARDAETRCREEASKLVTFSEPGHELILLDETGKNVDSAAFADLLAKMRDDGCRNCVFAIGGPDGHDPSLRTTARHTLSFGKLTWPHQLARIMLAEQLYRAVTILSGHPYHRG